MSVKSGVFFENVIYVNHYAQDRFLEFLQS